MLSLTFAKNKLTYEIMSTAQCKHQPGPSMVTRLFAVHRNAGSHVMSPDSQMKNTNAEALNTLTGLRVWANWYLVTTLFSRPHLKNKQ